MSGGTDLISCFALGNPLLPVYRGELQCRGLGMKVEIFDAQGRSLRGAKGELVCTAPFPSMPVGFWNDPDGRLYHKAYFARFPNVWCHGDYAELTEHDGLVIYGRSDAVLNPGGVRIGTAEIYRIVEQLDGDRGERRRRPGLARRHARRAVREAPAGPHARRRAREEDSRRDPRESEPAARAREDPRRHRHPAHDERQGRRARGARRDPRARRRESSRRSRTPPRSISSAIGSSSPNDGPARDLSRESRERRARAPTRRKRRRSPRCSGCTTSYARAGEPPRGWRRGVARVFGRRPSRRCAGSTSGAAWGAARRS